MTCRRYCQLCSSFFLIFFSDCHWVSTHSGSTDLFPKLAKLEQIPIKQKTDLSPRCLTHLNHSWVFSLSLFFSYMLFKIESCLTTKHICYLQNTYILRSIFQSDRYWLKIDLTISVFSSWIWLESSVVAFKSVFRYLEYLLHATFVTCHICCKKIIPGMLHKYFLQKIINNKLIMWDLLIRKNQMFKIYEFRKSHIFKGNFRRKL